MLAVNCCDHGWSKSLGDGCDESRYTLSPKTQKNACWVWVSWRKSFAIDVKKECAFVMRAITCIATTARARLTRIINIQTWADMVNIRWIVIYCINNQPSQYDVSVWHSVNSWRAILIVVVGNIECWWVTLILDHIDCRLVTMTVGKPHWLSNTNWWLLTL